MSTVQFRSEGYDKLGGYTIMIRQLARFVDEYRERSKKIRLSGDLARMLHNHQLFNTFANIAFGCGVQ